MGLDDSIRKAVKKDVAMVSVDDNLRTAIRTMTDFAVTALVVHQAEAVIGLVTDMDLMLFLTQDQDLDAVKVAQCLTPCELITARPGQNPCVQLDEDQSIRNALKVMSVAGVHNLLVTGANEQVVGTISTRDLLAAAIS